MSEAKTIATETEDEKLDKFMTWLRENGAIFPKIKFPSADTVSGIRGAIATETIETDEVMLEIPFKLMICEPNALQDPEIGSYLTEMKSVCHGDSLLAVFIMKEYLKGEQSFYWPYLNILPPPGTVSEWSEAELQELQDKVVYLKSVERMNEMKSLYTRRVEPLCEAYPEIFPRDKYSLELFLFTYNCVCARGFGRRLEWSAMVPFADCLNHSNVQNKYDFDVDSNGMFRMFPTGKNKYLQGGEVFNSYGRRKNIQLLLDYGFALLDNEWDELDFGLSLNKDEENYTGKAIALNSAGLFAAHCRLYIAKQYLPVDVFAYMRILNFTAQELEEYNNQVDLEVTRSVSSSDPHPFGIRRRLAAAKSVQVFTVASELRAIRRTLSLLQKMNYMRQTSIRQDEEILAARAHMNAETEAGAGAGAGSGTGTGSGGADGSDYDYRLVSAVHYRLTKKRIADATVEKLIALEQYLDAVLNMKPNSVVLGELLPGLLAQLSALPPQPGVYIAESTDSRTPAEVILDPEGDRGEAAEGGMGRQRVGALNTFVVQTQEQRSRDQAKYLNSLLAVCAAYLDGACSEEGDEDEWEEEEGVEGQGQGQSEEQVERNEECTNVAESAVAATAVDGATDISTDV